MTEDELKAIRKRLNAATPGPWIVNKPGCYVSKAICSVGSIYVIPNKDARLSATLQADAKFIAHAPTDIAALLAEVERLQERCEQLYQWYDGLPE